MVAQIDRGYISGLDGIRALAISVVFVAHAGLGHVVPGGFGVTTFFFLSGYLITRLLLREHAKFGCISIRAFYERRAMRIFPPFLVTFLVALLLAYVGILEGNLNVGAIFAQAFFFSNYYAIYFPTGSSVEGLGILWSLAIEEHFYFVWPFVFIALQTRKFSISWVLCAIAAILIWRVVRVLVFNSSSEAIYLSTDTRFDSMLFGCILAFFASPGRTFYSLRALPTPFILLITGSALGLLVMSFCIQSTFFRDTLRYSLQGIALLPLFFFSVERADLKLFGWLNTAVLRWIGRLSYVLYLAHNVIINGLEYWFSHLLGPLQIALLALALSLIFAQSVYYFVEAPCARLRKDMSGHTNTSHDENKE
ncbi:acyltransferase family protein [Yoonia maritima]|uniref:acyltransferase family protein n=1 Tax=Yoonia maritima TaxID=1435347 RepID=UPI000D112979|nr:acyltransferase [Yoonia maritima]